MYFRTCLRCWNNINYCRYCFRTFGIWINLYVYAVTSVSATDLNIVTEFTWLVRSWCCSCCWVTCIRFRQIVVCKCFDKHCNIFSCFSLINSVFIYINCLTVFVCFCLTVFLVNLCIIIKEYCQIVFILIHLWYKQVVNLACAYIVTVTNICSGYIVCGSHSHLYFDKCYCIIACYKVCHWKSIIL